MPRTRRLTPPGTLQHVIARFVGRERRLDVPGGRDLYLERFAEAVAASDAKALSFNLMGSHVHHALIAGEDPLEDIFRPVHTSFAVWANKPEDRFGPVFAGRFKSITIDHALAPILIPYIHNNDVRAGIVPRAALSKWSSHRYYLGLEDPPPWLDIELALRLCGFDTSTRGRIAFDLWVDDRLHRMRRPELSSAMAEERRRELLRELRGAYELSTPIVDAAMLPRWQVMRPADVPREDTWRGSTDQAIAAASIVARVDVGALRSRTRAAATAETRAALLIAWTRHLGRRQVDMARSLGMSESGAASAIRRGGARDATMNLATAIGRACRAGT